ncbi:MAG: hypothetical protein KDI41_02380 [Pseudomonadales bacterium]|nr:hypothetical protein [Pseudomonadales bacterium]
MLARGDCEHTSFYCEENVHRLLGRPELAELPRWVVFISNVKNSCALWQQRAAGAGRWVIWDYHVVVMARHDDGIRVYDLDSRLTFPTPLAAYVTGTFPFATRMPVELSPRFRVVPADRFLATFSSDRSHMRTPDGGYTYPPPPWPPIQVEGLPPSTLARFVDMNTPFEGEVMDLEGLLRL